jgi:hypothetical protein
MFDPDEYDEFGRPKKPVTELRNLKIASVDLVGAPANLRRFLLWKSEAGRAGREDEPMLALSECELLDLEERLNAAPSDGDARTEAMRKSLGIDAADTLAVNALRAMVNLGESVGADVTADEPVNKAGDDGGDFETLVNQRVNKGIAGETYEQSVLAVGREHPEAARKHGEDVSTGRGTASVRKRAAEAEASLAKAAVRPPKHPFLVRVESHVAKSADPKGKDSYWQAALAAANGAPGEYESYASALSHGRG